MQKFLSIFIFFFIIFSYPSFILAQEYNPDTDRCSGKVGIKGERQAVGDTECADALSCPEELRNKKGGCGPIISKESFIDKALSGICSTVGLFCRWGESGTHIKNQNLPYALHDKTGSVSFANQTTQVHTQADSAFSIIDNLLGTQSNTGGLRGYFPNELLADSKGKGALETHRDLADCSNKGGLGLPYELCKNIIQPEQGISNETKEGEFGESALPPQYDIQPTPNQEGLVYFSQRETAYAGHNLPGICKDDNGKTFQNTIGYSGCGPSTVAMALASFSDVITIDSVDKPVNPATVSDFLYKQEGYSIDCGGTTAWDAYQILRDTGKFEVKWLLDLYDNPLPAEDVVDDMKGFIDEGWKIFAHASFYWKSQDRWIGHYFLITDVDEDGNIMVMDPYFGYKREVPLRQTGLNPLYKGAFGFKP